MIRRPPMRTSTRARKASTTNISRPSPARATERHRSLSETLIADYSLALKTSGANPMRLVICTVLAVSVSSPLFAQTQPTAGQLPTPEEIANKDIITVALGGAYVPDYEGSDDYRLIPAGAIRGKVSGISFTTRGSYLYVDVIPGNAKVDFDAGPI